jgi:4-alpha-glucanotransferase
VDGVEADKRAAALTNRCQHLFQIAKIAFIGLNPIHALYPANPESASPYSPSSRRWLNVI